MVHSVNPIKRIKQIAMAANPQLFIFFLFFQKMVTKRLNPKQWRLDRTLPKVVTVGIDMSLNCPGMVVLDPRLKVLHFYWLRQFEQEPNDARLMISDTRSPFDEWEMLFTCLPWISDEELSQLGKMELYNRMLGVVASLISVIPPDALIHIEGYAFNALQQSSQSLLMELGGILRLALSSKGYDIVNISPTHTKKRFSGKGKASKIHMYQAWKHAWYLPDIVPLLHPLVRKRKRKQSEDPKPTRPKAKDPCHPVQDLCDALACAVSG